ncbi:hypothetical protein OSTOST_10921, partial [Ostertagia ostertagi]
CSYELLTNDMLVDGNNIEALAEKYGAQTSGQGETVRPQSMHMFYMSVCNPKASVVTSRVFRSRIAIVQIIEEDILRPAYGSAIMSVACYARAQGYEHFILVDKMFFAKCLHKNKFFLHHCIVAYVLRNYDYVLYLDVNIGVVNPKRRIEDYIDEDLDLIFFERMANWGLTTETYLARNSQRAQNLLN